jgi:hypothetical protein
MLKEELDQGCIATDGSPMKRRARMTLVYHSLCTVL